MARTSLFVPSVPAARAEFEKLTKLAQLIQALRDLNKVGACLPILERRLSEVVWSLNEPFVESETKLAKRFSDGSTPREGASS